MTVNSSSKNKIDPNIFRAYDIRGIYPDELNEKVVFEVALAFSSLYPEAKRIALAHDPRLSSPALSEAITKALLESGKEVIYLGIAPDPLFYFAIFHFRLDGGMMISGSHNPKEYNGLTLHIRKPGKERSEDIIKEDLQEVKRIVLGKKKIKIQKGKGKKTSLDASRDYIDYVASKIKLVRPLKIIVDSGNGAMGYLPEKVFRRLGCDVKTLYGEPDGNFPHHLADPYEEKNLKDIKKEVISQGADLGFAFDTDGDRVGPIDNRGRQISGDSCLFFLALQELAKKKGPIVHDMRVSKAFLDEMKRQGVKTYFSVSHHNAVIKRILETGAVFGGEITYHFLFPMDYYLVDDALFPALKIAEVASQKEDFAKYLDSIPRYQASPEIFIPVADEKKFELIRKLQRYLRENNYNFIDVDGARINFEKGWALARASNTSPFIKCRFEGETAKDLEEVQEKARAIFEKVDIPIKIMHNKMNR